MTTLKPSKTSKLHRKCRCCTNPSNNFMELEYSIKTDEGMDRTYKELLYEITKLQLPAYQEKKMPQQICHKCGTQLKNSYKFIQQTWKVSEQYLLVLEETSEDIKDIEQLEESLIEISEARIEEENNDDMKVEPLSIDYTTEIKEENEESEVVSVPINKTINDESQEERDLLENSNSDNSSEGEDDSDEPESFNEVDLSKEPIARRCDICNKLYKNEKILKIHKRNTHLPEEDKIPCPFCTYKASRSSALKVHMGLLHGQDKVKEYFKPAPVDSSKKYPCKLCPRSYGRKDSLGKHIRRNHLNNTPKEPKQPKPPKPKERFLCTCCGQSYSTKCGLENHMLSHTGERSFSCEICSKTFKRSKDLQLHSVIHSDEKPHQCIECGKAFKRIDKLKFHMRVHSDLRPYKCSECEKTFKYSSVLKTHMYIHTGQTKFVEKQFH